MIKKCEGIVVSEIDYKESSKIINVLTKEHGIIGMIAKGCKKPNNKLSNRASILTYGYFHISYKEEGLSTLIEVDIIDNLKNIKKDIIKISYACFLCELVMQVYKHESNNNIYNLFASSLIKINEGYDPLVITNILELKLLEYLAIMPNIDSCVSCASTNNIVTISSYKGGYLCSNCLKDETVVNSKTIKLIRMFYYVDISKITKLEISEKIKKEINTFIDDYYDRYSGLYLKSKEFLKELRSDIYE